MQESFWVDLHWPLGDQSANTNKSRKNHTLGFEGKSDLPVSAAKTFKGDPALYNPEELLLGSLMSCHMMSYLYCAQKSGLEIVWYKDQGEAFLRVFSSGSGAIEKVILRPCVAISSCEDQALALSLHKEAHTLCFIANSCKFEIVIEASVQVQV